MTMRVVIVHNRYRSASPSGENRVVEADVEQLRADGVDVITYFRDSDEIADWGPVKRASLAVRPTFSLEDQRAFRDLLERTRPDIVHLHNPYPLISPSIIRTAKRQSIPVVQTVHNYRHSCVNGLHFRDGAICTECQTTRLPWPAVRHGCYQETSAATLPMAVAQMAHHRTWKLVDLFLAVGKGVADNLKSTGVSEGRIQIRPNPISAPARSAAPGRGILYVGRLSEEKGVSLLLAAWRAKRSNCGTLTVVGDGVLAEEVRRAAAADESIRYLGRLDADGVAHEMHAAGVVCIPSLCWESDGLVAAQALANGRPVIITAGGLGGTDQAVAGAPAGIWLVDATVNGLAEGLDNALRTHDLRDLGRASRALYEARLNAIRPLVEVYAGTIGRRAS